jgi:Fe-S oxidoreductase
MRKTRWLSDRGFEKVILFWDPFAEYYYPDLVQDARLLLKVAGCDVYDLSMDGSGRTLLSKGFLMSAKRKARNVLEKIKEIDPAGVIPVIGVEPSEILTLRDEYPELLPTDEYAQNLAGRSFVIDEFLVRNGIDGFARLEKIRDYLEDIGGMCVHLHGHCYQKTLPPLEDGFEVGVEATTTFLQKLGFSIKEIETGCCGMAGAFGYEEEHYDFSMQVGELKLFPYLRSLSTKEIVIAPGVSCRSQIEDGTGKKALHPISLVKAYFGPLTRNEWD